MSPETTRYVICYDIPDDKRRNSLAKALDSFGDRVQYSVFEALLDKELFDNMVVRVRETIVPDEDRVVIYPLCAACAKRRLGMGLAESEERPGEETVFII